MSPDEYQALIVEWVSELEQIKADVEDLRWLAPTEDPDEDSPVYAGASEAANKISGLLYRLDKFAWPDASGVREALFDEINRLAADTMRNAEKKIAKAKAEMEREFEDELYRQHKELSDDYATRLRAQEETFKNLAKKIADDAMVLKKRHDKAMREIEAEIDRRVQQRLYGTGIDGDRRRPKRPLMIGG